MTNNTATTVRILARVRELNSWSGTAPLRGLIFATPAQRLGLSFRIARHLSAPAEVHPLGCMCLADDPADDRDYA